MTFQIPNKYEDVAHDALREACLPNGARFFSKVRMGDVFPLTNANVPAELRGYGLRSHFDFLVTTGDRQPLFSVDFDRPPHRTSNAQTARDRLKDRLCQNFGHPLLRIGSDYVTKTYRGLDLLTYFVEAWFLGEAFDDAQQKGLIPYDEPFGSKAPSGSRTRSTSASAPGCLTESGSPSFTASPSRGRSIPLRKRRGRPGKFTTGSLGSLSRRTSSSTATSPTSSGTKTGRLPTPSL